MMDAIIALDSYDDIFDDFDPQAYIERNISADFLDALGNRMKKVNLRERAGIILTLPYYKRVIKDERIIKERLSEYFWNMARYWTEKESDVMNYSLGMMLAGLVIFTIGQFIIHNYAQFFDEFIVIPAWFLTFSGLDKYLVERPKITSKRRFYEALSGAKVSFTDEACFTDATGSRE